MWFVVSDRSADNLIAHALAELDHGIDVIWETCER